MSFPLKWLNNSCETTCWIPWFGWKWNGTKHSLHVCLPLLISALFNTYFLLHQCPTPLTEEVSLSGVHVLMLWDIHWGDEMHFCGLLQCKNIIINESSLSLSQLIRCCLASFNSMQACCESQMQRKPLMFQVVLFHDSSQSCWILCMFSIHSSQSKIAFYCYKQGYKRQATADWVWNKDALISSSSSLCSPSALSLSLIVRTRYYLVRTR